jgi:hypothetical protein
MNDLQDGDGAARGYAKTATMRSAATSASRSPGGMVRFDTLARGALVTAEQRYHKSRRSSWACCARWLVFYAVAANGFGCKIRCRGRHIIGDHVTLATTGRGFERLCPLRRALGLFAPTRARGGVLGRWCLRPRCCEARSRGRDDLGNIFRRKQFCRRYRPSIHSCELVHRILISVNSAEKPLHLRRRRLQRG